MHAMHTQQTHNGHTTDTRRARSRMSRPTPGTPSLAALSAQVIGAGASREDLEARVLQLPYARGPRAVLGVDDRATLDDARRAYRALALLYHPDKWRQDEDAAQKADAVFKEIARAWERAQNGDPEWLYPRAASAAPAAPGPAAPRASQPSSPWERARARPPRPPRPRRPPRPARPPRPPRPPRPTPPWTHDGHSDAHDAEVEWWWLHPQCAHPGAQPCDAPSDTNGDAWGWGSRDTWDTEPEAPYPEWYEDEQDFRAHDAAWSDEAFAYAHESRPSLPSHAPYGDDGYDGYEAYEAYEAYEGDEAFSSL